MAPSDRKRLLACAFVLALMATVIPTMRTSSSHQLPWSASSIGLGMSPDEVNALVQIRLEEFRERELPGILRDELMKHKIIQFHNDNNLDEVETSTDTTRLSVPGASAAADLDPQKRQQRELQRKAGEDDTPLTFLPPDGDRIRLRDRRRRRMAKKQTARAMASEGDDKDSSSTDISPSASAKTRHGPTGNKVIGDVTLFDADVASRRAAKNNNNKARNPSRPTSALQRQVNRLGGRVKKLSTRVDSIQAKQEITDVAVADLAEQLAVRGDIPQDGSINDNSDCCSENEEQIAIVDERVDDIERCLYSIAKRPGLFPSDRVLPSDTELVRPRRHSSLPILAPITAYNWRGASKFPAHQFELPIYQNINSNSMDFWHYIVDELLLSRAYVVLLHGRGCYEPKGPDDSGPGNMCPRLLRHFVEAVRMADAMDVVKVGMFYATGSTPEIPDVPQLDLSSPHNWNYLWEYNIEIWFDTIPKSLWYRFEGKPVIAFWTLSSAFFKNQEGHASLMLDWIKGKFLQKYGLEPHFLLQKTWFENDSTITEKHALGKHGWFKPKSDEIDSAHSFLDYNGKVWGVSVPGFRDAFTEEGCGEDCREVTRREGQSLVNSLDKAAQNNATMVLLEGWTDMAESAGFYRSNKWEYPNQYINLVRKYSDPEPETLRFQAEAADAFYDVTVKNQGRQYANRSIDVGEMPDKSGWYVGYTSVSEWLEYQNVELSCGRYRFTAKVATRATGKKLRLDFGDDLNSLPTVDVPFTGGLEFYELVHLGQLKLRGGSYNLRLVFESTGGLNVDWFFAKRVSDCYCELDEQALI